VATRYGWEKAKILLAKGWKIKVEDLDAEPVFGDRRLIDPATGESHGPYEAEEIQAEREGK
jgi:hypothetical protein